MYQIILQNSPYHGATPMLIPLFKPPGQNPSILTPFFNPPISTLHLNLNAILKVRKFRYVQNFITEKSWLYFNPLFQPPISILLFQFPYSIPYSKCLYPFPKFQSSYFNNPYFNPLLFQPPLLFKFYISILLIQSPYFNPFLTSILFPYPPHFNPYCR